MGQLHFITKLLDIKDPNIQILDIINKDTHKEIIAKLDYDAPSCPECGNQLKKYDFQKPHHKRERLDRRKNPIQSGF
ncbi:IS1167 transposase [Streptococcus pneumoniae]|nr:IS1167 transposase [Streptococcus pneumoniae]